MRVSGEILFVSDKPLKKSSTPASMTPLASSHLISAGSLYFGPLDKSFLSLLLFTIWAALFSADSVSTENFWKPVP